MSKEISAHSFRDRLSLKLELTIAGKKHTIAGGDVKNFQIELVPYGLSGSADFWFVANTSQSEDKLFTAFVGNDPIEVSLTVGRERDQEWGKATPMTVKGIVTERAVEERAFEDVTGKPILHRKYSICFADRAAALWQQHHPTVLTVLLTVDGMPVRGFFQVSKFRGVEANRTYLS